MKKISNILRCSAACLLLLLSVSCRDTSGQKSGTEAGQEANGDTRGTETPADNEGSGSSRGATPSSANDDQ